MLIKVVIFEDEIYRNFLPLTATRAVFDLRCGIYSFKDRINKIFSSYEIVLYKRQELYGIEDENYILYPDLIKNEVCPEEFLFVNGRLLLLDKQEILRNIFNTLEVGEIIKNFQGDIVAFKTDNLAKDILSTSELEKFKEINSDLKLINFPWDLIEYSNKQLEYDIIFHRESMRIIEEKNFPAYSFYDFFENVYIDQSVIIEPGVSICSKSGPVIIDEKAHIMANSVLKGPCYIGKNTIVKVGSKLYEGTNIGDVCKIGGEVESTIFHSFSNKQHDGFLGHSYIGSWCNFGAGTNNSDLKNNYTTVSLKLNGKIINSGSIFFGMIMGDHSKTGINTMFNTGSVIGVACNIYGGIFPDRNIADFHWVGPDGSEKYSFEKTIEVVIKVMERRGKVLTEKYHSLLKKIFDRERIA